jgi:hypothetical protein
MSGGVIMNRDDLRNMMMVPPRKGGNGRNSRDDNEELNLLLDYVVKYDDGFRSRIHVYGIDSREDVAYGAIASVAVSVGVDVKIMDLMEINPMLAIMGHLAGIDASVGKCGVNLGTQINGRGYENPIDTNPDWEFELQMDAREQNMNCVKIISKDDIDATLKQHAKNYSEQFHGLGEQMMDLYMKFLEEHPGYKMGEEFSPGDNDRRR